MSILVINGSPKGKNSDTMRLTRAFLEGMNQEYDVIDVADQNILPCRGCYACWYQTPGRCPQADDMAMILSCITRADLVIWSTPLYCYGVPSQLKALIDRMLPLSTPTQYVDERGRTHHPAAQARDIRMMLISGCGFPDREGNFDALIFQFKRMFGDTLPMILCVEAPLLSIPAAAPVAEPYLAIAKLAGEAYAKDGRIPEALQKRLDAPMFPPDQYRATAGR